MEFTQDQAKRDTRGPKRDTKERTDNQVISNEDARELLLRREWPLTSDKVTRRAPGRSREVTRKETDTRRKGNNRGNTHVPLTIWRSHSHTHLKNVVLSIEDNVYASLHPIDELALSIRISSTSRQQHNLTRTYARFGVPVIDSVATSQCCGYDSDRPVDYLPTRTPNRYTKQTKTFLVLNILRFEYSSVWQTEEFSGTQILRF